MTYKDQLKDPRWLAKSAEIKERDNKTCQCCRSTEYPLDVHHKIYIDGRMAWEYDGNFLITLCNDCHKDWHVNISKANDCISMLFLKYNPIDLYLLANDLYSCVEGDETKETITKLRTILRESDKSWLTKRFRYNENG